MNEVQILAIKADLRRRAEKRWPADKERQNAYVWATIRRIEGTRK